MSELTKEYFDEKIGGVATDIAGLKSDVSTLKTDVSDLKSDVSTLKTDVSDLKSDVSTLKSDMRDVKAIVQRLDKRDKEDSDAFAKDIVQLQKDVKLLKLKHA
jgi:outer membrane murein-binding lipoprotein Lpp